MKTLCYSSNCERMCKCARHYSNNEGTHYLQNWYLFGSENISSEGYTLTCVCGELGNWEMFKPVNKIPTEDCLIVNFDSANNNDDTVLTVARIKRGKIYIENIFRNEEAVNMYNKLLGNME